MTATLTHKPIDFAAVETWLASLDNKLTRDDMTPRKVEAAQFYLDNYDGDFEFLVNVKNTNQPSLGAYAGVLNCWRAEVNRNKRNAEPGSGINLDEVPAGRYMTEDGARYVIDHPDKGKWTGWVFVKSGSDYETRTRYGSQRPGNTYKGAEQANIAEIAADPHAAAVRYGKATGTCGRCGATLEDPESVERGIGPVCATYYG